MSVMTSIQKTLRPSKGQALVELTLMFPLMLALLYGAIEVGSVISDYLVITHTAREGANLTSRGTDPNTALAAIEAAASPMIRNNNLGQWRIIYSRIIQSPTIPCPSPPCTYIIDPSTNAQNPGRLVQGNFGQSSKLGAQGAIVTNAILPGINNVGPNQIFHVIEVYYDYTPNVMTYVGSRLINKTFYERSIFTNVTN